jgi:NAD(P)H-hydrate repair Nnr-like enzyme with NAD(P)H-hydrate epimerase domain
MLETLAVFSNIQPHMSTHPIASVDFPTGVDGDKPVFRE